LVDGNLGHERDIVYFPGADAIDQIVGLWGKSGGNTLGGGDVRIDGGRSGSGLGDRSVVPFFVWGGCGETDGLVGGLDYGRSLVHSPLNVGFEGIFSLLGICVGVIDEVTEVEYVVLGEDRFVGGK